MAESSVSQVVSAVQAPTLSLVNGKPRASSLDIAEKFDKRHSNVMRLIKRHLSELPEDFNGLNFEPVEYTDEKGEKRPAYLLTRDAFSLLVMGFTGSAALAWKLRYIEAFNAMETALRAPAPLPLSPFPRLRTLPKARRQELNDLVLAKLAHVPPAFVWKTRMSICEILYEKNFY